MFLTGLADEAGSDVETQIRATLELGWGCMEARAVGGVNVHELDDAAFDRFRGALQDSGIRVNCLGSAIGNWAKSIRDDERISYGEATRSIRRMQALGTSMVRVMSYQIDRDRPPDSQDKEERFRRLRELGRMFADAGIVMAHENCKNWGGMCWQHTEELLDAVPGVKLIFDTGNPVDTPDYGKPEPRPMQDAWEFYEKVRDHVVHVHIKDARWDPQARRANYVAAGDGQGSVRRIVRDLVGRGYDAGFCIEPHVAVVFHDAAVKSDPEVRFRKYVDYGHAFEAMLSEIKASEAEV